MQNEKNAIIIPGESNTSDHNSIPINKNRVSELISPHAQYEENSLNRSPWFIDSARVMINSPCSFFQLVLI